MRLIDADALKEKVREKCKRCIHEWDGRCEVCLINAFSRTIDNALTVKSYETFSYEKGFQDGEYSAEMKRPHGKWDEIREPFGWDDILSARCSACGESYPYPEDTGFNDIVEMFKYCPNCGAKMEAGNRWKEEEDEE